MVLLCYSLEVFYLIILLFKIIRVVFPLAYFLLLAYSHADSKLVLNFLHVKLLEIFFIQNSIANTLLE